MILALLGLALAAPERDLNLQVSAGADVVDYNGQLLLPWLPYELGGDVMVTAAPWTPWLRLGLRQHVVVDRYAASPDPGPGEVWVSGHEVYAKTWLVLGFSHALPARLELNVNLLPGVRLAGVSQRVRYPEYGVDARYRGVALAPSLYGHVALRWWPLEHWGLHVDVQGGPLDPWFEYAWYPNRVLGVGLDWRAREALRP